jgi:hypothetical protein
MNQAGRKKKTSWQKKIDSSGTVYIESENELKRRECIK